MQRTRPFPLYVHHQGKAVSIALDVPADVLAAMERTALLTPWESRTSLLAGCGCYPSNAVSLPGEGIYHWCFLFSTTADALAYVASL